MKKEYTKPYLAVESFQLDAAIAGACANKPIQINHQVNECVLGDNKGEVTDIYFGAVCGYNAEVNDDGTCYQAFVGSDTYLES